jgi:hypothetical protein
MTNNLKKTINISQMKKIILTLVFNLCLIISMQAQKLTTQDFNLPKNTILYVDAMIKYNGETKAITPIEQNQYEFKNGYLQTESVALITYKIANQKSYKYNNENQLTTMATVGGALGGTSYNDEVNFTYTKELNRLITFKKGLFSNEKKFNSKGTLIEENIYDAQSNYIFEKILFETNKKTTKRFNPKQELVLITTEYFNNKNNIILDIVFNTKYPTYNTVTTYTYDANENLIKTTQNKYVIEKLKKDFEYYKNGSIIQIPDKAIIGNTQTTTYYNYAENNIWTAQTSNKQTINDEIEVKVRAIQTNDGKMYNTNNQVAFMTFLDDTYQKIKAQKP